MIQVNGHSTASGGFARITTSVGRTQFDIVVTSRLGMATTYTITVDRGLRIEKPLQPSPLPPNAGYALGFSTSASAFTIGAHYAVVNPSNQDGFVAVLNRSDTGFAAPDVVRPENLAQQTHFGWCSALATDLLVVCAPNHNSRAGAVHVFRRQGTGGWVRETALTASNAEQDDSFGSAIALDGDTLVVGAPGEASGSGDPRDNSAVRAGAVYVFRRTGTAWMLEAYLKGTPMFQNSLFGTEVALSGDTILVGAVGDSTAGEGVNPAGPYSNTLASMNSGAVFLFERSGTTWTQKLYVKPKPNSPGGGFGTGLALSGAWAAIGEPGGAGVGEVTILKKRPTGWVVLGEVRAPDLSGGTSPSSAKKFGVDVAIHGDFLVAGAPDDSSGAPGINGGPGPYLGGNGSAHLYHLRDDGAFLLATLRTADPKSQIAFGQRVGINSDFVFVMESARVNLFRVLH